MSDLILVTHDGFAKRVPLSEIRRTRRAAKGVKASTVPVVAAITVARLDGTLVLAAESGKVVRVAVRDIPLRHREVRAGGRMSRGVRVIRVTAPDRVATAVLAHDPPDTAQMAPQSPPAANRDEKWPGGRVGLESGESVTDVRVFAPVKTPAEIAPGGGAPSGAGEWTRTAVHRASRYWCLHCGREHPDPDAVYECIDRHAIETDLRPFSEATAS